MSEIENPHYSFIVRCWRDASGVLRGNLIDPLTNVITSFTSIIGLHQALDRVISEIPLAQIDNEIDESQPAIQSLSTDTTIPPLTS